MESRDVIPFERGHILVTGASGHIGREVVAQLRTADLPVRALSRNPHARDVPDGVEIARGDLTSPDTLDRALDDVAAVFLVWVAPLAPAAEAIARIASRARRIVFLSAPIHTPHPFFQQPNPVRSVHAGVERLIETSAAHWTFLRPAPFAINCRNWWAPQIRNGDTVRWFHGSAETAPVHERDIAAVAVRALCDDAHDHKDYVLTGPESLTQREQLAIIGEVLGRTLVFDEVSPDATRREVLAGAPVWVIDMLLSAYEAAVDRPALVTSEIETVTGTPARTFHEWARDHAADFAS
jgi:uncharacterized protein YbjT (DUF2867 family)